MEAIVIKRRRLTDVASTPDVPINPPTSLVCTVHPIGYRLCPFLSSACTDFGPFQIIFFRIPGPVLQVLLCLLQARDSLTRLSILFPTDHIISWPLLSL